MQFSEFPSSWRQLRQQIARLTRRDDAEDLLHSSYLRMIDRAEAPVENPRAFLIRSAINAANDDFRRARHPAAPVPLDDKADLIRDVAPLQDEAMIARARLERVRAGLGKLSPRTREIFLMHRLDGMKYREIAEALDISVSAVEKHVAKAAGFLADWAEGW